MNAGDFPIKTDAIDGHHHSPHRTHDAKRQDHPRALGSEHEGPQAQKHAKQGADGHEDNVESFEGHGDSGLVFEKSAAGW